MGESEQDITLGEIHRLLLEVRADVKLQNGTVNRHETRLTLLESREADARQAGGKWGAIAGGAITGIVYVINAIFSGHR